MDTAKYIFVLLIMIATLSCKNEPAATPKPLSSAVDDIKTADLDEIERVVDSTATERSFQNELDFALKSESIDPYFKDVFDQKKLIPTDDSKMNMITDSLFTTVNETKLFYFIVFTKSMNGADGYFSEDLGVQALNFVTQQTKRFATYFTSVPQLNDQDLNNWAACILGEIMISREKEEQQAIQSLGQHLREELGNAESEQKAIIEGLLEKIQAGSNSQ